MRMQQLPSASIYVIQAEKMVIQRQASAFLHKGPVRYARQIYSILVSMCWAEFIHAATLASNQIPLTRRQAGKRTLAKGLACQKRLPDLLYVAWAPLLQPKREQAAVRQGTVK